MAPQSDRQVTLITATVIVFSLAVIFILVWVGARIRGLSKAKNRRNLRTRIPVSRRDVKSKRVVSVIEEHLRQSVETPLTPNLQVAKEEGWGSQDGPLSDHHFRRRVMKAMATVEQTVIREYPQLQRTPKQSIRSWFHEVLQERPDLGIVEFAVRRAVDVYEAAVYGERQLTQDEWEDYMTICRSIIMCIVRTASAQQTKRRLKQLSTVSSGGSWRTPVKTK